MVSFNYFLIASSQIIAYNLSKRTVISKPFKQNFDISPRHK